MRRRAFLAIGGAAAIAGCLGAEEDPEDAPAEDDDDEREESVELEEENGEFDDIAPVGDVDGFPGHGNMADGPPEEIVDFPAFVARLENAGLDFDEPDYTPGTGLGIDIMIDSLPETLSDIEFELNTLSEAYWAWMIYDGELKPPDDWDPVEEGNEEYPPLGLDNNFHTNDERVYVAIGGSQEAGGDEIVQYVTGEIGPDEYADAVAEGTGLEW